MVRITSDCGEINPSSALTRAARPQPTPVRGGPGAGGWEVPHPVRDPPPITWTVTRHDGPNHLGFVRRFSAVGRSSGSRAPVCTPHNMDCPRTRWPESLRICDAMRVWASDGPDHLGFVCPRRASGQDRPEGRALPPWPLRRCQSHHSPRSKYGLPSTTETLITSEC